MDEMDEALLKKLQVKAGRTVLLLNPPPGYRERLLPLPEGAALLAEDATSAGAHIVQVFVHRQADVESLAQRGMAALKPGGVLWLTYPKRSKTVQTDVNRDTGWDSVTAAGWLPVTQIAVDEMWSALRFRPVGEIKTLTRKS